MPLATTPETDLTVEEIAARVGAVPFWRIRTDPPPGTATEADVERIRCREGRLCELIDGVLVEKAVSEETAGLAVEIIGILRDFVKPRRLGWLLGPDGFFRLYASRYGSRLRAPDVSFIHKDQRPDGLVKQGYSDSPPALVVEVFSPANTVSEMERKRDEFFAAGTELFWIVYPERGQIEVSTGPQTHRTFGREDTLDGGDVLPGFSVKVDDVFDAIDLESSA